MPDHVYRIIEVAGSSEKSIEDAIQSAVSRASRTLRGISWFEVLQTRGQVEASKLQYQVVLKVGFTLEDPSLSAPYPLSRTRQGRRSPKIDAARRNQKDCSSRII